ncbi:MAG TPA: hypothetical protein VJ778_11360 [Burkholderiales bacterium]|nr:hypothetical protein [Burkholderiales bacterium]
MSSQLAGDGFEREEPSSWPERPAMPRAELEALGAFAPGAELSLPAVRLLTPYRFDIPAKYVYAVHREKGVKSGFARRLYTAHLRVWNNLHELEPVKRGIEAYLDAFHEILDSTKATGFDPEKSRIPLGRCLSPINGSHRVAACLAYGKDAGCRLVDEGLETHNYNYLYFRNRGENVPGGLAPELQNAIALEYCRLKPQTLAVLVFPSAQGRHRRIMDILLAHGHVVYEKEFWLGPLGRLNLMRCVYAEEPWLGTARDGYVGAQEKADYCFDRPGPLRLFIFETYEPGAAVLAKSEIRALFEIGNHSVHINDSHEETLRVAEALLNQNSLHFLENARSGPLGRLHEYLSALTGWLSESRLSPADVCVGGSAVLAVYGLREGKDLDFLHHLPLGDRALPPALGSHNEYIGLYGKSVDDLIYDPANHFYYAGFKFASLPIVAHLKMVRGERKDATDLSLIEKIL